jgi:hypothetical protein
MPIHIYPNRIYGIESPEIRTLIEEFGRENYRVEEEEDEKEKTKCIRLIRDNDHTIAFIFIKTEEKEILHYVEIRMLYENEYKKVIEKIASHIRIYSLGWI